VNFPRQSFEDFAALTLRLAHRKGKPPKFRVRQIRPAIAKRNREARANARIPLSFALQTGTSLAMIENSYPRCIQSNMHEKLDGMSAQPPCVAFDGEAR
jgi:hypothetical protein